MAKFLAPTTKEISEREIRHMNAVRALSGDCMVLLQNNGVLPLTGPQKIALYGNGARATVKGGTGSGDVYVRETVNIEEGLLREGFTVTTKDWIDRQDEEARKEREAYEAECIRRALALGRSEQEGRLFMMLNPMSPVALAKITEEDIQKSDTDTAVYVLSRNSGEGRDRLLSGGDYELSEMEKENLKLLTEKYEKLIVLLNIGGMIDTKYLRSLPGIGAIVLLGQLGNITGLAAADLLLGKAQPSGKLTDSWAENYQDLPAAATFGKNNGCLDEEYYTEGIYVGYRFFDSFNVTPAYEFGFGLSYTDFAIEVQKVSVEGTKLITEVRVTNTGSDFSGKEVVQLYVSSPEGKLRKPYQELRAFQKTGLLAPGESEVLKLTVETSSFASYDEARAAYVLEAGEYVVRIGNSSRNTRAAAVLTLQEEVITEQYRNLFIDPDGKVEEIFPEGPGYRAADEEKQREEAVKLVLTPSAFTTRTASYTERPLETAVKNDALKEDGLLQFDDVASGKITLEDFIADLSEEELAYLSVGAAVDREGFGSIIGAAAKTLPGAAGETTGKLMESRGLKQMELCDGPAGVRLAPEFIETPDGGAISIGGMSGNTEADDIPEGIRHYQYLTAIPIATSLASSWDLQLIEACGDIAGAEMEAFGATLWLAPGMNIHRNPLCGRNFEYYSEDPLLAGKCAAADTLGVQKHPGYGTTVKHFLGNNQEDERMFVNDHISERAIREIYARNFRIAVEEAQPMSVMTSYNLVNGVHAANNMDSITHLLRDEWGFKGMVMTDWFTTADGSMFRMSPGEPKHGPSDPAVCVKVGNDLIEPGAKSDFTGILKGLSEGVIRRADLEACARRILTLMLRTHLYADRSYYENVRCGNITFTAE